MQATVYLWLLGMVLSVGGGVLLARGWWLDKAAGNHKRARCRRCWYELSATPAGPDGITTCPECGTIARSAAELHRVRRNAWTVAAGLLLLCGGGYLASRPVLDNGKWLYMLPRSAAARLWKSVGAEWYGQMLRQRVAQGTATEAEVASLAQGAKAAVLAAAKTPNSMRGSSLDNSFKALALEEPPDPEVEKAAADLVAEGGQWSHAAMGYFTTRQTPLARRMELIEASLAATRNPSNPYEYFQMLGSATDNAAAMRALVRHACDTRRGMQSAQSVIINAGAPALLAVAAAFKESSDDAERQKLANVFRQVGSYHVLEEMAPFVLELCEDKDRKVADIGQAFLREHPREITVSDAKLKEWIESPRYSLSSQALYMVGCEERDLPEGCGAGVLKKADAGYVMPCRVLSKFSGADRRLWLDRLAGGTPEVRRAACGIIADMRPPVPGSVEALRAAETDPRETEEMRVAARDALKRMGAWLEPNRQRTK